MKRYDSYKDSGIKWIGEIPDHWVVKRFNYLFAFSRGLPITKQDLKDEGIPCVSYGEIHSKYGFKVNPEKHLLKNVDINYLKSSGKSLLNKGDFIFADTSEDIEGSGNFTCLDSDTLTFAGYHTIIAIQRVKNNYTYLAYFFDSLEFRNQIRSEVSGIKVFSITNSILKNSYVLLPPQSEQTVIANFLDCQTAEIDRLIAEKKRLIELYEEEKTVIINQAVTKGINPDVKMKDSGIEWLREIPEHWEVKRFGFLFSFSRGLPITKENLKKEGTPCISYGEIHSKCGFEVNPDKDVLLCVNEEYLTSSKKSLLKRGDFVFSDTSEDIKGSGNFIYLNSDKPTFAGYHTIIAIPKEFISHRFVAYFFESLPFRNQIRCKVTGIKVYSTTQSILKSTFVLLPPPPEQLLIANHLESECTRINAKVEKTKKLIALLTEYRTTLISEAVTGKIKVFCVEKVMNSQGNNHHV